MDENKEKDLFLKITQTDLDAFDEDVIAPLYQNCLIRWADRDAPNITIAEVQERVALFIGEVAAEASRRYLQSIQENGYQGLHPHLVKKIYDSFSR